MPAAQELLHTIEHAAINADEWAENALGAEWWKHTSRLRAVVSDPGPKPLGMALARPTWVKFNHLRTGVGRFRSNMHKWGLAQSMTCECGAEEQTADHIILDCPLPPYHALSWLHGLAVLGDNTITWLLQSCPDI